MRTVLCSAIVGLLLVVGLAVVAVAADAPTTAPATAPAAEKPLFGFEDDSKGPFGGMNVTEGPTVVAENATEGAKSLMIAFEVTDKSKRPTFLVNKPQAFVGAKTISFDIAYVGDAPPFRYTKLRLTARDSAGKIANEEQALVVGKNSMTVSLDGLDSSRLSDFKITVDAYTGKGKFFLDNVKITK